MPYARACRDQRLEQVMREVDMKILAAVLSAVRSQQRNVGALLGLKASQQMSLARQLSEL